MTIALVGAAACGAESDGSQGPPSTAISPATDPTPATIETPEAPPFSVDMFDRSFVDRTRATPATPGDDASPVRVLLTRIALPVAPGPFPLILFAHGLDGHPRKLTDTIETWASAGYVVVAPAFPATNDDVAEPQVGDFVEQPADVSFVLDELLADPVLSAKIDDRVVGIAAHSLGATAAYALIASECCRDIRIDAAIVFAGLRTDFDGGWNASARVPLLVVQGTDDASVPLAHAVENYAWAQPPKAFLTLQGAMHAEYIESTESPFDDLVAQITTNWWDALLKSSTDARERFSDLELDPNQARLVIDL